MTDPKDIESQRKQIIAKRNRAVALTLAAFVVLFFVLTLVKFPH
jgi:hypothetical protein